MNKDLNSFPSLGCIELVSPRRSYAGAVSFQSLLVMQFPLNVTGVGIRTYLSGMQSGHQAGPQYHKDGGLGIGSIISLPFLDIPIDGLSSHTANHFCF